MSDGSTPNDGDLTDAPTPTPPSVPPYAAAPHVVQPGPAPSGIHAQGHPVPPPYAAGATAADYGGPRQEYPGAPPTWGPPGGAQTAGAAWPPRPASTASSALAILALVASLVGLVIAFVPFVGPLLSWALFATAVILAIVALVKRTPGKGMSIAAIVVSGCGFLLSLVVTVALIVFGAFWPSSSTGYGEAPSPAPDTSSAYPLLGTPDFGADGNTLADPLSPGSALTISDDNATSAVWSMTVLPFEDLTAAAVAGGDLEPVYGAYVGVPVQLTNLTDESIDLGVDYSYVPYTRFVTADGGDADATYLIDVDAYPSTWDVGAVAPGESVTFYEVYDVAPDAVTSGAYVVDLDSGQTIYWTSAAL